MQESAENKEVLERLLRHLDALGLGMNDKLPVERTLARDLGMSRDKLRKALAVLEEEGKIWRQVGRGTFIGPRPVLNLADVEFFSAHSSPGEVMEARMAIEPQIAALAATHATQQDRREIARSAQMCRRAADWRSYEVSDISFHRAIAQASHNKVLIHLFETLNLVRRTSMWRIRRETQGPPPDYPSFAEHDEISAGIDAHDASRTAEALRRHLGTVNDRIIRRDSAG